MVALQGVQSDGTDELVQSWAYGKPKVRVYRYPFDSAPNGPGHDKRCSSVEASRAFFYNWTTGKGMDWQSFYDDETRSIAKARYAEDLKTFAYDA